MTNSLRDGLLALGYKPRSGPHQAGDPCRYCEGPVELVRHREVYGRDYGKWPYLYLCRSCGAYVGLHPHTQKALGSLADAELREARKIWKGPFLDVTEGVFQGDRSAAYRWLAEALGIDAEDCHWGLFEVDRCIEAGHLCKLKLRGEGLL